MKFNQTSRIKAEISKEDFLRQLLIDLNAETDTPLDIADVEFGQVRESSREVLLCEALVAGTCSASVGIDKQEAYTDYVKKQNAVTSKVTYEKVTKYKTVTDWAPFTTKYNEAVSWVAYNCNKDNNGDEYALAALRGVEEENIVLGAKMEFNENAAKTAMEGCRVRARKNVPIPGDHRKDVKYSDTVTVKSLVGFVLPYYEVTYTYKGYEYEASAFACGEIKTCYERPVVDLKTTELVKDATKEENKKQKLMWALFAGSMVLSVALCFVKFAWLFPLTIVTLIMAVTSSKKYTRAYEEYADNLSGNMMKIKLENLQKALERHDLEPLDEEEAEDFEAGDAPEVKEPKCFDNRIKLSWILVALLAISSLSFGYQIAQNSWPQTFEVTLVEKDERKEGSYNYCVDFAFEIKSKKYDIKSIDLDVHVSEDGEKLGTISLREMALQGVLLEKGEKDTFTITKQFYRPQQGDELFEALWEKDIEDLEFEIEVTNATFVD